MLDTRTLDIPCPACGQKTAKTIGWVKTNDQFTCPACSGIIDLDRDQFLGEIAKIEKAVAKFRRDLRKL